MYFPDPVLLPFIKTINDKVRSVANNSSIMRHSKQIIEVATHEVFSDNSLMEQFKEVLQIV